MHQLYFHIYTSSKCEDVENSVIFSGKNHLQKLFRKLLFWSEKSVFLAEFTERKTQYIRKWKNPAKYGLAVFNILCAKL